MNERDVVSPFSIFRIGSTNTEVQITRGIHTDCLLNYETVKYFGGEIHEGERYADAIRQYQVLEYKVISKYYLALPLMSTKQCLQFPSTS
jgi:ABC-type transport system involved in Fe-S cluster assembly fused permease/ATPase subunit